MRWSFLAIPMVLANSAAAQEDVSWGEHFYQQNCSVCHGEMARGDGELADLLTIPVPDLTTLSEANDGEFPMLDVIHVIDGRSGLRAHQEPMPVYGALFREELRGDMDFDGAVEPLIRGRTLSIAEYLMSIQR
ncbi:c-type cytochrome [Histidinibacterium aquaticum]|uniref:Cytochrome c n=1 Tax=Histidinibacterium aquaticum TaxID=2613962 RepID=A0A5J5GEN4_9RHOB|nr:c-type cytochrome [Histidinibacterium aquaticum]KAA9006706.1 cytochrome c [Histidinibacterium aquaticum]